MKVKNLYLLASIKWQWIIALFEKGHCYEAKSLSYKMCSFCKQVIKEHRVSCRCDGGGCSKYCKIDKEICGAPGSLMDIFDMAFFYKDIKDLAYDICRKLIDKYHELKVKK